MPLQPQNFTQAEFTRYILTCAIRDRQAFLEAMQPDPTFDPQETQLEIQAMRHRLRRLTYRPTPLTPKLTLPEVTQKPKKPK